jgi:hypothetical protein
LFFSVVLTISGAYSQMNHVSGDFHFDFLSTEFESNIAYKLPFRGNNYKFYGTISYHVLGRAFTRCNVHNTIVEAFFLSELNCTGVNFKILKSSAHTYGRLYDHNQKKSGKYCYFMTPMIRKGQPVKHYYRTGLFRFFLRYDKKGQLKSNSKIRIDFDAMARFLINLDISAGKYGLRIKKIVFNRFYLKELFKSESGKLLKERDIYFAKYLSDKVNNRFDDIYYVEFELIR